MGIPQLLPFLEQCTRKCHVSEFRDCTIAIDSYCWLHKGARTCSEQLIRGETTDAYIQYCLKYVKMLLSYQIKPIMVFDGRYLPAKVITEIKRKEIKEKAKKHALELMRMGKIDEARKSFMQCVEITPLMALAFIKECRKLNVDCIVAPYESDAQLAYFSINNMIDCVITEDSDLMLFGCKKVLYKMDITGCGQLVESDKMHISMKLKPEKYTFDKFRYMCILSGCDYVNSLPGIGLKNALKFITMTEETNPEIFLDRVPRYLNKRHITVDEDYKENFLIADATFRHQTVFDPIKKMLVPLTSFDIHSTKPEHCRNAGDFFDNTEAFQLAIGNLNPLNMEKIDNWKPPNNLSSNSIWSECYKKPVKKIKSKNSTISVIINNSNIEKEINDDYDNKFQKELELYKSCVIVDEKQSEECELVEETNDESSVLNNINSNPFIKQKISKFSVTNIEEKTVVKSRFFHSKVEVEETEICETVEMKENSNSPMNETIELMDTDSESTIIAPKLSCVVKNPVKQNKNKKRKINPTNCQEVKKQVTIEQIFRNMKK